MTSDRRFFNQDKSETPEQLRRRLGINKDDSGSFWENAQNFYLNVTGRNRKNDSFPKDKTELAKACELHINQVAWDLQDIDSKTKFIYTLNLGGKNKTLNTLAYTAESPDVQLQMLRESGQGFPDLVLKMSQNPGLNELAIDYIVARYSSEIKDRTQITPEMIINSEDEIKAKILEKHAEIFPDSQLHNAILEIGTEPEPFLHKILETENPNKELVARLSTCFLQKGHFFYTDPESPAALNIPASIFDNLINTKIDIIKSFEYNTNGSTVENYVELDEILCYPTIPTQALLRFTQENQFLSEELSSDKSISAEEAFDIRAKNHEHNLSLITIISIILKHPNSTPEIAKIVLDQFNKLNVPLQMEYLKAGLIDGFYNNPNLPENPFTRLESLSKFINFKHPNNQEKHEHGIQKSLQDLYSYIKNKNKSGDFNDLIFKIATEPKFPKELQTEFFAMAFNAHGPLGGDRFVDIQIRQKVKADLEKDQNDNDNLPDHYLFNIAKHENTQPEVLNLIFEVLEKNKFYFAETETKSEIMYIKILQKIAFKNPNLAIDLRLNIVDARTGEKYYTIPDKETSFGVDIFLKNLLKAPENTNPQDFAKRVEFELNNWLSTSNEHTPSDMIKTVMESLDCIPQGQLVLSPEIFTKLLEIEEIVYQFEKEKYIRENPDKIQYMKPPNWPERFEFMNRKLAFFYNLFSRSELEEIYKVNPKLVQDWISKNYDGTQEFDITIKNLLAIAKSKFTPTHVLRKIVSAESQSSYPTGVFKEEYLEQTKSLVQTLFQNPNLDGDMIDDLIVLINGRDSGYTLKKPRGLFGKMVDTGKSIIVDGTKSIIEDVALDFGINVDFKELEFKISPEIWKLIVNHPNTRHSSIGEIYVKADAETKKLLLELYTNIDEFKKNPEQLLDTKKSYLLTKIPFQMLLDLQNKCDDNDYFKNVYYYVRNWLFRNSEENRLYLKDKVDLPADTTKFLQVQKWIPMFWDISDRTRNSDKPADQSLEIEQYVVSPANKAREFNIAYLLNITKTDSIPNLLLEIKDYVLKSVGAFISPMEKKSEEEYRELRKFLANLDIEIDRTIPDAPVLVFRGYTKTTSTTKEGGPSLSTKIIQFFHNPKYSDAEQPIKFEILPHSELDKKLGRDCLEWRVSVDTYYYDTDSRETMTEAINDKLTAFRNKLVVVVENFKKAKIELQQTYYDMAMGNDIKDIVQNALGAFENSEAQLADWLNVLSLKLEMEPDYLKNLEDQEALAKLDQKLDEVTNHDLLKNLEKNTDIIKSSWKATITDIPEKFLTRLAKNYGINVVNEETDGGENQINTNEAILNKLSGAYSIDDKISFTKKVRIALHNCFHEKPTISNLISPKNNLTESDNLDEKTITLLNEGMDSISSNRKLFNDLREFIGNKIPIIRATVFGGLLWRIKKFKIDTIKKLKPAEDSVANPISEITNTKEYTGVEQKLTPGILAFLNSNHEVYKNMLKTLPPDSNKELEAEIYTEQFKTQILINLLEALGKENPNTPA